MDILFVIQQTLSATLGVNAIIFALAAIGLNMHFGYTGLLNFGQAGFLAIGAYSVAVPVTSFGLSLWVALLIGIFNSVIFALLLGVPTLRLRADYLAIVTIAFAEIVRQVARSATFNESLGGSDGITGKFGKEFFDLNGNVHNGGENQQESSGVLALRNLPPESLKNLSSPQKPVKVMQHDQGCIGTLRKLAGLSCCVESPRLGLAVEGIASSSE